MADLPTIGGSQDAWGTALNTWLSVEHESDGTHDMSSLLNDGTTYFTYSTINGTEQKIYTKFLTGTLDADAETSVAHGITGVDKILSVVALVYNSDSSTYCVAELFAAASADDGYTVKFDGTNVIFGVSGTNCQGQKYRLKIDYYV